MIHFVIGTRAQFFKMAPLMQECQKRRLQWRWIYTAQHKETMEQSVTTFGLSPPDYTVVNWETEAKTMGKMGRWLVMVMLGLFRGRQILGGFIGPKHIVLTHGDTITTWWAALLGKLYRCKVMHIEAGLRSHNLFNPFPEEINRIITGRLSDIHHCPGPEAVANLRKYKGEKLDTTYNTLADTIAFGMANCEKSDAELPKGKYVVASIHRYENIFKKEQFLKVIKLLEFVAQQFKVKFVLHPATRDQLEKLGLTSRLKDNKNIELIPRLEYLPFIKLIKHSEFVITDGGGNQEELYFMGQPTLLFRHETERPDELGITAVLSKFKKPVITKFLKEYKKYKKPVIATTHSPSKMIIDRLEEFGKDRA